MCFITSYRHHPLRMYTVLYSIQFIDPICNCLTVLSCAHLDFSKAIIATMSIHAAHVQDCTALGQKLTGLQAKSSSLATYGAGVWSFGAVDGNLKSPQRIPYHNNSQLGFFACGSLLPSKAIKSHGNRICENLIAVVFQRERKSRQKIDRHVGLQKARATWERAVP